MNMNREKTDKRVGWAVSLAFHVMILALFFLINAWTAPDPPLPEYGIELNLGLEQAGFGTEEPVTEPAPTVEAEQEQPEPQEEIVEEQEPEMEEQPVTEPEPAEPEPVMEEMPDSQQDESPVTTEPEIKPEETKPVESPPEKKPEPLKETKPEKEPVPVEETKPEKPEEKPKVEEKKVDTKALYPGGKSQGDKKDETGDAGVKEGTIESRALYGKPGGGGGGPSLDLAGWRWDKEPNPKDTSKENGRIVFEIKVDANGDIIGVKTLEKTVSPAVERIYKGEVYKLTFSPTSDNVTPPPETKGKITFIIRSR